LNECDDMIYAWLAGLYDADEVVQLYVAAPQTAGYIVPFRQLEV